MMKKIKTISHNNIFIDEFGNILIDGDFTLPLGTVDALSRFKPSKFVMEQGGLSTKYLDIIIELIKTNAGFGEKKAEEFKENIDNN
jgi:hypothetical protein